MYSRKHFRDPHFVLFEPSELLIPLIYFLHIKIK